MHHRSMVRSSVPTAFPKTRRVWAIAAITMFVTATHAATDPVVRGSHQPQSAPPDTVNPIDTHLPASQPRPEGGVSAESWLMRFMDLHTAMRYTEAAEAALALVEAAPDRPVAHYNLACVLAKLGRGGESMAALERAVDLGWRDRAHLEFDPDLAGMRKTEAWSAMIERLQAKIDAERMIGRPRRTEPAAALGRELAATAPAIFERFHVPGAVVVLIEDGRPAFTWAHGLADPAAATPMTADLPVRLRAPLHLLTLAAGMQQQQAGVLDVCSVLEQGWALTEETGPVNDEHGEFEALPASGGDRRGGIGVINTTRGSAFSRSVHEGWPVHEAYAPSLRLLQTSVEITSGRGFRAYCQEAIFDRLDMAATGFAWPRDDRAPDADSAAGDARSVVGHSRLGTPMNPSMDLLASMQGALWISADDLARLVSALAREEASARSNAGRAAVEHSAEPASPERREAPTRSTRNPEQGGWARTDEHTQVAAHPALDCGSLATLMNAAADRYGDGGVDRVRGGGLGLWVEASKLPVEGSVQPSSVPVRFQLADLAAGIGCLAWWDSDTGRGIVIVFNSETGPPAALRIAHQMMGGD